MIANFKEPFASNSSVIISEVRTALIQFGARKHSKFEKSPRLFTSLLLVIIMLFAACEDPEAKFGKLMSDASDNMEAGEFDSARINLFAAIELKPKHGEAYFKLAEVLVRLGKIRPAVENYNTAINYVPDHQEARLHLASIMLAGRQFELAESHAEKVLELDPKQSEALILKANVESMGPRKNRESARKILAELLSREPENLVALASLANVELADGNQTKAEQYYQKALVVAPNNTPVQMALADLYARQGRLDEAQETLASLIDQNPDQSSLRYVYGEFLLRRGLGGEAVEQYQETLKADPLRHDARDRLYDMFVARGENDQAKALTADLVRETPDDPGTAYFKGRDAELDGEKEKSLAFFLDSIKIQNSFSPAFRRAGMIEIALGKTREGMEHLNQAVAIDGGDIGARLALARTLFLKKDLAQSKEHLQQILKRYPRHLGANILLADIALIEDDTTRARKVYEFLVESFPKSPSGYFKLGLLEEKEGNNERAMELYRTTLSFDRGVLAPSRRLVALRNAQGHDLGIIMEEVKELAAKSENSKPEYDLLLGTLTLANQVDEQRFEKARELFLSALEARPSLIGAYFALGAIDSVSGDLDAAVKNYELLLEKSPNHIPTLMLLALTRERMGSPEDAADVYRSILTKSPRFGPASNNLAWLLAAELDGNLDEALKFAETAKEELPRESSVSDTLGWVHYKRGNTRAALPYLEEAVILHKENTPRKPVHPEILFHLATVKAELGETADAKKLVAEAMKTSGEESPKYAEMKKLFDSLG